MGYLSAINSTVDILLWLLIFSAVAGVLLFLFYWFFTFKVNVTLRWKTSTKDQLQRTNGKYVVDKVSVEKLIIRQSFLKRKSMPMPPPDAISLSMNGKHDLELEVTQDGNWRYMVRETSSPKFKPYDSNDKVFHVNEHDKMLERRSKKTWMQIVSDSVPYIALVLIIAMLIFGWSEFVTPMQEESQKWRSYRLQMEDSMQETASILKEVLQQEQIIRSRKLSKLTVLNNTAPPPE